MRPRLNDDSRFARLLAAPAKIVAGAASFAVTMAAVLPAADALAQAGAGAERYEVTISPPKRPGSEPPPAAEGAETLPAAAGVAAVPPGSPGGEAPASTDAGRAPAEPASAALAEPAPPAQPSGPPRTLQVAAFRQHDRAETLRGELAGSFPDVAILEVQSGGEPLYRVNVGRLPKGPALDELRKRLAAAGFPSFDVAAPAKPSED